MILHHDQVDFSLKFTVGSTQAINKCNTIYKVRTVTTRSSQRIQKRHWTKFNQLSWWKSWRHENRWIYLKIIKALHNKPMANTVLNGGEQKDFLGYQEERRPLTSLTQRSAPNLNYSNKEEKDTKGINQTVPIRRWSNSVKRSNKNCQNKHFQ